MQYLFARRFQLTFLLCGVIIKLVFIGMLVYVLWRVVVNVAPYNYYVLMPVVSTEGGARAARATLTFAVYHLNVRV